MHRRENRFAAYASGLVSELNEMIAQPGDVQKSTTSSFQKAVHSIHFYPYVLVIEKHRGGSTRIRGAATRHAVAVLLERQTR